MTEASSGRSGTGGWSRSAGHGILLPNTVPGTTTPKMGMLLLGGAVAGLVLGYILQRGQLCFHAAFRGLLERRGARF